MSLARLKSFFSRPETTQTTLLVPTIDVSPLSMSSGVRPFGVVDPAAELAWVDERVAQLIKGIDEFNADCLDEELAGRAMDRVELIRRTRIDRHREATELAMQTRSQLTTIGKQLQDAREQLAELQARRDSWVAELSGHAPPARSSSSGPIKPFELPELPEAREGSTGWDYSQPDAASPPPLPETADETIAGATIHPFHSRDTLDKEKDA